MKKAKHEFLSSSSHFCYKHVTAKATVCGHYIKDWVFSSVGIYERERLLSAFPKFFSQLFPKDSRGRLRLTTS